LTHLHADYRNYESVAEHEENRLAKEVRCIDDKCETRKNAEVDLEGLTFLNSVWIGGGGWADISAARIPALLEESDAVSKLVIL